MASEYALTRGAAADLLTPHCLPQVTFAQPLNHCSQAQCLHALATRISLASRVNNKALRRLNILASAGKIPLILSRGTV
jgi:hypothetical protein